MTMPAESPVPPSFRPMIGLIGALVAGTLGILLGSTWIDAVTPAGVGFLLGGAFMLFRRIWLHLLVVVAVLGGTIWLLAHYAAG